MLNAANLKSVLRVVLEECANTFGLDTPEIADNVVEHDAVEGVTAPCVMFYGLGMFTDEQLNGTVYPAIVARGVSCELSGPGGVLYTRWTLLDSPAFEAAYNAAFKLADAQGLFVCEEW